MNETMEDVLEDAGRVFRLESDTTYRDRTHEHLRTGAESTAATRTRRPGRW